MTKGWSLPVLLSGLHDTIQQQLAQARESFAHPGTKGDASEAVWLEMLQTYLPERYRADKAHVVDSEGNFSEQMDVVVYDRQYSPFIFKFRDQLIIPAESVYAVFEAKQTINAGLVEYTHGKIASARKLKRTSLPIPHAGGVYDPKPPAHIIGGLLTLESDWKPAFGEPIKTALKKANPLEQLDMGCVAAHGHYTFNGTQYDFTSGGKPATAFLLELIARLQATATVPMIDIRAYARWLL
ncbi:hypothetical protein SAMN05421890_4921 [Ensifer adhaerens]|nr:hypothetical protein SAMN05421890_4921 [Ensifer adhaerens]